MQSPEFIAHQSHASNIQPADAAAEHQPTPEELAAAIAECERFLGENASHLGALFGLRHFSIRIGKGWTTTLETGEVTADPSFFIEKGYTPQMAAYAILHEVAAHLREVEFAPALTREVKAFLGGEDLEQKDTQLLKARSIFHDILSDAAGNQLIHATLPAMKHVATDLYSQKLFARGELSDIPRHLQFLYKTMRTEMIPGAETTALPEVDALISELRDYRGRGDLIAYSTQVAKSRTEAMSPKEKFDIWTKVIYPRWLELYETDKADPNFQKQSQQAGEGGGEQAGQQPSQQSGDEQQGSNTLPGQPQPGKQAGGQPDFSDYYQHYHEELHPEPIDHAAMDKLQESIQKQQAQEARDKRREEREAADRANPTKQLDAQIRRETGHSLADKQAYDRKIMRWHREISQLRDVFRSILNDRITHARRLRGNHAEGALLNPDTLTQTYIDVTTNHPQPPAFADYEHHETERRITGKTDYVFVFDRSSSMSGERSKAAAATLVICLEALAGMERDIRAAEAEHNLNVDLDIRTALYTFNKTLTQPKQLSSGLSDQERFDSYGSVTQPTGGTTHSLALQHIETYPVEPDRQRIIIVVTDGEPNSKKDIPTTRESIGRLRAKGWHIYGVSIGSDAAVQLYAPDSQRIDDPAELPATVQSLIERTL